MSPWVSCFWSFGMNSETHSPPTHPLAIRNARIDANNRSTDDAINKRFSRSRTSDIVRLINNRTLPTSKRAPTRNITSFAEKDFIAFSIKKDGSLDKAKDGSSRTSDRRDGHKLRSLRSVNIELKSRGKQEASVQERKEETSTGGSRVFIPYDEDDEEDDEEKRMSWEEDNHFGSVRTEFRMEGYRGCARASIESRESGQSDGSTDSFTFPELHGQWIGSPVKMPRGEDLSLGKSTASCVRFKCCNS